MTEWNFIKMIHPKALLIAEALDLSDDAKALLTENITPEEYTKHLIDNLLYADAIMFLAAGLAKRESTWWACLCARSTLNDASPEYDLKAIELAEAWVYKPSQENCSVTLSAAEATGFKTPAGWSAMAAFWSGDNISPNEDAVVPPPNGLTGKAVNGAVLLAAVQGEATKAEECQRLFLTQGVDIACGGNGQLENK